ncbi:MAG: pyridoxal-phosphate dependent enzyme, partial [Candidatus Omnitrophica bacterium]|nr:pyridoxal-phosphate dependent enzyme [Candidatus Omnitrophota bacterium]
YKEYRAEGVITELPAMMGFQAAGSAPIVEKRVIKDPKTIATAIKIGNPASWQSAEKARDESGGLIDKVTDDEILEAYKLLAEKTGVFVEPASAASVAGVIKKSKEGYFPNNSGKKEIKNIVCILTGHGLKDPDRAIKCLQNPVVCEANLSDIVREAGL